MVTLVSVTWEMSIRIDGADIPPLLQVAKKCGVDVKVESVWVAAPNGTAATMPDDAPNKDYVVSYIATVNANSAQRADQTIRSIEAFQAAAEGLGLRLY